MKRALAMLLLFFPALALAQRAPDPRGTLRVSLRGLEHSRGTAYCALFRSANGFPDERERAFATQAVSIRARRAECVFSDLRPGIYAVAVAHDEDDDGELDTSLFGAPTEGWGVSNDAPANMGPPEWAEAKFRFDGRATLVPVTMRY